MLLKLALRNIRRSLRDYAIYFVTLLFAVAVFYAFNSIEGQQVLFDTEAKASADRFRMTQQVLSLFSWVIAAVLGFLIVYANRFIIKRRKHEFGTYLLLGMSPGAVSRIVLYETVIVGVASLAAGLAVGIMLSQALSFFTAALFAITMSHYQFVFSEAALFMTLWCFVAIYVVVALFNLVSVRRYKLIDLLSAKTKNEKSPVRNPWVCLVAFIVSVGIIAVAYLSLVESGLQSLEDPLFVRATVLMLVGTLVFFWALAGFTIALLQRLRGVYLRGLAMFTVRQIASKVNTAFLSLWAICVLLFFAITTFASGMGMVSVFAGDMAAAAPYSATVGSSLVSSARYSVPLEDKQNPDAIRQVPLDAGGREFAEGYPELYALGESYGWDMAACLRDLMPEWDALVKASAQIDTYEVPGLLMSDVCDIVGYDWESNSTLANSLRAMPSEFSNESGVNATLAMMGRPAVEVEPGQILVVNNLDLAQPICEAFAASDAAVPLLGNELHFVEGVLDMQAYNSSIRSTGTLFVLDDADIAKLREAGAFPIASSLNVMYVGSDPSVDEAFCTALERATGHDVENTFDEYGNLLPIEVPDLWPMTSYVTQAEMFSQSNSLRMTITYLALYIGLVFLITTAAILAIQQLSETADSQSRYRMLSKLGCDERMLNRSLLAQVLVYFLAPLALACCHAACAISVISENLFKAVGTSLAEPIFMAAAFTVAIYGSYLLITYFASRTIMSQAAKS